MNRPRHITSLRAFWQQSSPASRLIGITVGWTLLLWILKVVLQLLSAPSSWEPLHPRAQTLDALYLYVVPQRPRSSRGKYVASVHLWTPFSSPSHLPTILYCLHLGGCFRRLPLSLAFFDSRCCGALLYPSAPLRLLGSHPFVDCSNWRLLPKRKNQIPLGWIPLLVRCSSYFCCNVVVIQSE